MMFHGYTISKAGETAGLAAIKAQLGLFGARTIGKAIEPHVRKTSKVWKGATRSMAAAAAAEQLIFDLIRDGKVVPGGAIAGVPHWRRKS